MKPHARHLSACLLLALLAGCGGAGPAGVIPAQSAPWGGRVCAGRALQPARQYTIRLDGRTALAFDCWGNEIPPERRFQVLYDVATGLPQCQKQARVEDTGEDDEYGSPILRRTTALFDMRGGLLRDYEEADYDGAFGRFLIRHDPTGMVFAQDDLPAGYQTALWDMESGQAALDGVADARPLDGARFLLTDKRGCLLGVAGPAGEVVSGFPPPQGYYTAYACAGGIVAGSRPPGQYEGENRDTLLTPELTPLRAYERINGVFYGLRGPYLLYEEGGAEGVLDGGGNVVYTAPAGEGICYFDGELAILSDGLWEEGETRRLVRADGTELVGGCTWLEGTGGEGVPAPSFLALRGGAAEIYGRQGELRARRALPGAAALAGLGGGLITCQFDTGKVGLYSGSLQELLAPGVYSGIERLYSWHGGAMRQYPLLDCTYYLHEDGRGREGLRHDLRSPATLQKVATGLTAIGDAGPGRLAVQRGFWAGLMDFAGNWVVKKSIFCGLNDDYDEWGAYL